MKRITTLLLSCLVSTGPLLAQQGVTAMWNTDRTGFVPTSILQRVTRSGYSFREGVGGQSKLLRCNGEIPIPGMQNMLSP